MSKNLILQKEKSLVNAFYKLTLDEQRLFHYAVAKVNPFKHRYGQYYLIGIKDLISFYGLTSKSAYSEFYSAVDKLFNRQCTYYSKKLDKQVTCRLIVDKIQDDSGVIGLRFSDQMSEMITNDKDFLAYKLSNTIEITSPSANRLYEIILYSLQRCPVNKLTKIIEILELKNLMGLDKKYDRFSNFKKFVLEVSKNQINLHTDIRITYEVIKSGRTPTHLKFSAQFKKGQEPNSVEFQNELPIEDAKILSREESKKKLFSIRNGLKI